MCHGNATGVNAYVLKAFDAGESIRDICERLPTNEASVRMLLQRERGMPVQHYKAKQLGIPRRSWNKRIHGDGGYYEKLCNDVTLRRVGAL